MLAKEVSFVLFDGFVEGSLITETIEKVFEGSLTFLNVTFNKLCSTGMCNDLCVQCEKIFGLLLERIAQILHCTKQFLDLVSE